MKKQQEVTLKVPHPLANRIRKLAEREGISFAVAGIRLWDEALGTKEPHLCLLAQEAQ